MIALVAAIAENNCIGVNGKLPWHIPEDMVHFKNLTKGKVVLMGRKTWESLPKKFRPLPNRKNIVISSQTDYKLEKGVELYHSIMEAVEKHIGQDIMVIGGAQIYDQTIDIADRLYITHVKKEVKGDAFFPEIDPALWSVEEREDFDGYAFVTYLRKH